MRKEILSATFIIIYFTCFFVPEKCLAEGKNSFNLGVGRVWITGSGSIGKLEYEGILKSSRISFLGRLNIGKLKGNDVDGNLFSLEGGIHSYPNMDSQGKMEGYFFGGTLGYYRNTWKYVNYHYLPRESANTNGMSLGLEIGYRFNVGSKNISIIPTFQFVQQFNQSNHFHSEESQEADSLGDTIGGYPGVSLSVGFNF
jgi:hypothetical protein